MKVKLSFVSQVNLSLCVRPFLLPPPSVPAGNNVHRGHATKSHGSFALICVRTRWKSLRFQVPQPLRLFSNNEKRADDLVRPATRREGIHISFLRGLLFSCLSLLKGDDSDWSLELHRGVLLFWWVWIQKKQELVSSICLSTWSQNKHIPLSIFHLKW